ncbi:MAG: CDP-alcohol phosphatidyltransferase family protein [Acidimicrobiales bacterium]
MVSPDPTGAAVPAATGEGEEGLDRILTVPNAITGVRLLCVPLFVWLLFGAGRQTAAAILLGVLGATDWVDGKVARRFHQVSTMGKVLDPLADRILLGTAVLSVVVHGAVPVWFAVATLAREVVVSGTVLVLAALGARRIDVLWVGKAGAFGLMWSYPAFLLSHGSAAWQAPFHDFAWAAGGLGLALAWVAAVAYLAPARRALVEGRRSRATGPGTPGNGAAGSGSPRAVAGRSEPARPMDGGGPGPMQHTGEVGA